MSESIERKGPSIAGVFVGIMSVILCMLLVGFATSASFIIGSILIWAFIGCPLVMHVGEKAFWDLKVDWITGLMGAVWWQAATYLVIPGHYPQATFWAGLLLAVFTSIIIGKMARPPMPIGIMLIAGCVLGYLIVWMNNWAIHRHAVLALDLSSHATTWYVIPAMATSIVVVFISVVAQKLYQNGFRIEIPNNDRCK